MINPEKYLQMARSLAEQQVTLVAVSKTKSVTEIRALYDLGQRDFGENYVQELAEKVPQLPNDIRWHFIGHLQSNKVKYIAPFISMVQSIDSLKLLKETDRQGMKCNRVIDVLLQVHIAKEDTKFGMDENELQEIFVKASVPAAFPHIRIRGLMGMASFSNEENRVRKEFQFLKSLFDKFRQKPGNNVSMDVLSMGMSSDYTTAVDEGSNMVRIGSLIFGERSPV
jgi:PLP dependent protein